MFIENQDTFNLEIINQLATQWNLTYEIVDDITIKLNTEYVEDCVAFLQDYVLTNNPNITNLTAGWMESKQSAVILEDYAE